ncbi:MAG: hypothetical protein GX748_16295, partial [Lentisphaerae bacterium]|nr:hypothetical protein [Lentisphaerota bacterium]
MLFAGLTLAAAVLMTPALRQQPLENREVAPDSWLVAADGVVCDAGALRLDWKSAVLLDASFANGVGNWRVENYGQALAIAPKKEGDDTFLSIINPAQKRDTAFALTSPAFTVAPGQRINLRIAARGTPLFARARGHKDKYHMCLQWLSAADAAVGVQPFSLDCQPDAWRETRVSGLVPDGAARAVIAIGADSPDILPSEPFGLRRVTCSVQQRGTYLSEGEAVSRPLPLT